ncbi:MAG: hypothetical protein IKY26_02910 [Erysipelotrichaceae bacterium]|nr:hypothetical protein [Erysipelotrichaceae bacterium]
MILLHLRDNSSILLNPRHIKYVEKYPTSTYVLYDLGDKITDKMVIETPEEIQKLINEQFIPF